MSVCQSPCYRWLSFNYDFNYWTRPLTGTSKLTFKECLYRPCILFSYIPLYFTLLYSVILHLTLVYSTMYYVVVLSISFYLLYSTLLLYSTHLLCYTLSTTVSYSTTVSNFITYHFTIGLFYCTPLLYSTIWMNSTSVLYSLYRTPLYSWTLTVSCSPLLQTRPRWAWCRLPDVLCQMCLSQTGRRAAADGAWNPRTSGPRDTSPGGQYCNTIHLSWRSVL